MARKKPAPGLPEQIVDLTFPVSGLDLALEYELQRPQTTPNAKNVRTYETLTQRGRGGSRPGLNQYVPQQVDGLNLIQHLNYIVDPQADALETNFDPLDTPIPFITFGWGFPPLPFFQGGSLLHGWPFPNYGFPTITYPDAMIVPTGGVQMANGFFTRTGGNGIQPNKNKGRSKGILFVQANSVDLGDGSGGGPPNHTNSLAFNHNVGFNDLLLVVTSVTDIGATASIADSQGNGYTLAKSVSLAFLNLNLWYARANTAGPNVVSVTATEPGGFVPPNGFAILEYTGVASGPPTSTVSHSVASSPDGTYTTTPVTISTSGELLLGAFYWGGLTISPDGGFVFRAGLQGIPVNSPLAVYDAIGVSPGTLAVTGTGNQVATPYLAIGAAFKPA